MERKLDFKVGLQNRGNTCFMNTALQCLIHVPCFSEYILDDEFQEDLTRRIRRDKQISEHHRLTRAYGKMIRQMEGMGVGSCLDPQTFHTVFQRQHERFMGYAQQDSQEALTVIMDALHEGTKYKVEFEMEGEVHNDVDRFMLDSARALDGHYREGHSKVAELFYGQTVRFIETPASTSTSTPSKIYSTVFEPISQLALAIPRHHAHRALTIYDCLKNHFKKERLEGENRYLDEASGTRVDAVTRTRLSLLPPYLVIVLKRFKQVDGGAMLKNGEKVYFPFEDLDLSPYTHGYHKSHAHYDLVSVGCHVGDLHGGHYFAYCRTGEDLFYEFNDGHVAMAPHLERNESLYGMGYILVYRRK